MAGVVMPQAKEKGGGLEKLMSGLQIAGAVTGIQNNMAQTAAAKAGLPKEAAAAINPAGAAQSIMSDPISRRKQAKYGEYA